MKRRSFLQRMAAVGFFTGLTANKAVGFPHDFHLLAQPDLLDILPHAEDIASIGDAYLEAHATDRDKFMLQDKIRRRIGNMLPRDLRTRIAQKVKEDFATGDTVQLKGWVLSRTEAQQCALHSLIYS